MKTSWRLTCTGILGTLLLSLFLARWPPSGASRAQGPPAPESNSALLSINISIEKDAYVCSGASASNFGTYGFIGVGNGLCAGTEQAGTLVSFAWFNVGYIPAGKVIDHATLYLRLVGADDTGSVTVSASRAASGWSETGVTYANAPGSAGDGASASVGASIGAEYSFDVTTAVRKWYNGQAANNGFRITSQGNRRLFSSRRSGVPGRVLVSYSSATASPTASPTRTRTRTPTATSLATSTATPTRTRTATPTSTRTATLTASPIATVSPTPSATPSPSATRTATATASPSATATASPTPTWPVLPESICASADAYVCSTAPTTNFNYNPIGVGCDWCVTAENMGTMISLIRFNLPELLPPGQVIQSATLRLRLTSGTGSAWIAVFRALAGWGEDTVTWATLPSSSTEAATALVSASPGAPFTWDVTDFVLGWFSGRYRNYGLVLSSLEQACSVHYFDSREGGVCPELILNYTAATPTASVTRTATTEPSATAVPPSATPTPSPTIRTPTPTVTPTSPITPTTTRSPTPTPTSLLPPPTTCAAADAYVCSTGPSTNFNVTPLGVGCDWCYNAENQGEMVSLIRFSFPEIPPGPILQRATLRLRLASASGGASVPVAVRRCLSGWVESQVTWNDRPAGSADAVSATVASAVGAYVEWDVTAIVQGWHSYAYPNFGFQLRAEADCGPRYFDSRESEACPELVLVYLPGTPTPTRTPLTPTATPTLVISRTPTSGPSPTRSPTPPTGNAWLEASELEVTQVIQTIDPSRSAVPLVEHKSTLVRFYVRSLRGDQPGVTARLNAYRDGQHLEPHDLLPASPGGQITVGADYDRGDINDAFYFHLPLKWDTGALELRADVNPGFLIPEVPESWADNSITRTATFQACRPLNVKIYDVRTDPPPGSTTAHETAIDWVADSFPVPSVRVVDAGITLEKEATCREVITLPIGSPIEIMVPCPGPYVLPEDGLQVLLDLAQLRSLDGGTTASGEPVNYVGIVPSTGTTGDVGGLAWIGGWTSWCAMNASDAGVGAAWYAPHGGSGVAHELGHNYGRYHTDCGNPPDVDPGYPYDTCDLGPDDPLAYFGVRISRLAAIAPTSAADLMSYSYVASPRKPRWMSDYTYRALFNSFAVVGDISAPPADSSVLAYTLDEWMISGWVTPTQGTGALQSVYRLPPSPDLSTPLALAQHPATGLAVTEGAKAPARGEAEGSRADDYHIVLLNQAGAPIAGQPVTPIPVAEAVGQQRPFVVLVPYDARTAAIVLQYGARVLDRRMISAHAPLLSIIAPAQGAVVTDTLEARWLAGDADGDPLTFAVQYSPDLGASWQALAVNWFTTTFTIGSGGLPGSNGRALLRVMATDGANTTIAESSPFSVQGHAPRAHIVEPANGAWIEPQTEVWLRGRADDVEEGPLSNEALAWASDRDGPLGTSQEATVRKLSAGWHTITLAATDSAAMAGSDSVRVYIGTPLRVHLPLITRR